MFIKTLSLMLIIVSVGISLTAAQSVAAPGHSPAIAPSASRSGHPGTNRSQDNRAVIVESNLRSINRSLDATRPTRPAIVAPSSCSDCVKRAPLPSVDPRNQDRALRSSLHKLKRETAIKQSSDERRGQIEAARPEQP